MSLRKPVVVEPSIVFKSLRIAWAYSGLFLVVWLTYTLIKTGELGLPFILLTSQNFVYFLSQAILQKREPKEKNGDENDSKAVD